MGCTASVVVSDQTNSIKRKSCAETLVNSFNTINMQATITRDQKEKIIKSWTQLSSDLLGNGAKLMIRLFDINQEIKDVLGLTGLEGKTLNNNATFKLHSLRIMQTIGAAVDNLDDMENNVFSVLHDLGRQHFYNNKFVEKMWNPFPEAVLYAWKRELRDSFTPAVSSAWTPLLLLIVCKLKDGYQQACVEDTLKKLNANWDNGLAITTNEQ